VRRLREEFRASERRVCGLMEVLRSSCRYESRRDDGWLRERLLELAREHPRFGYRWLHVLLGREQSSGLGPRTALEDVSTSASGSSFITRPACFACLEGCASHGRKLPMPRASGLFLSFSGMNGAFRQVLCITTRCASGSS
jgi:hypothetical protein